MKSNNELSNAKLLAGAFATPILAVICAQGHSLGCAGIFAVLTLVTWAIVYIRAAEMVRTISGSLPRRHRSQPTQLPLPPTPPTASTHDDSRSIFL